MRNQSAQVRGFPLRRLAVRGCFPPTTFIILTDQECQIYHLSGKIPSNMTCNADIEPRGSMDDADKLSAPSIPVPGCMPRRSSCYGRCFARSVAPDAALRLARRKRGTSLPRPQSASYMRSGVICNPLEHKPVSQIRLDKIERTKTTITNCNKLQQTATNCNKLQQTATNCNKQTRTIKFLQLILAIL